MRTRIKICGIRDPAHARLAAEAGADAIGLVFHPQSPRAVDIATAAQVVAVLPPWVAAVGLFVNAHPSAIDAVLAQVPLSDLQFHGEESVEDCTRHRRPYLRCIRVGPNTDLLECDRRFASARGLLLDAQVDGSYGGTGKSFDWRILERCPPPRPYVLSGGLSAANVGEAIRRFRPWAVDVSSGVESTRGVKSAGRIVEFIRAVRDADAVAA
jgi:phosphoribosylanthranilate isomerase